MLYKDVNDFRDSVDKDEGLSGIRKTLTIVCIVFLAINLTGASVKEANTLIFKIDIQNSAGLGYLFLASIVFLTLRYYAYAQQYQNRLNYFWRKRLIQNWKILSFDPETEEAVGLLGKRINFGLREEPGVREATYEITGIFQRSVAFVYDEEYDGNAYTHYIELHKQKDNWKLRHYLTILLYECYYQIEATIKYRESLDLRAPYLLSILSIASYVYKDELLFLLK